MKEQTQKLKYIVCDAISAIIAWVAFFVIRKVLLDTDTTTSIQSILHDPNLWWGVVFVPCGWLLLYTIQGVYRNVLRKARLKELRQTFYATLLGVVVIFFVVMLDDQVASYKYYYVSILTLFAIHFLLTYSCRLIITSNMVKMVHSRRLGFATLLIGSSNRAYQTYLDLENQEIYSGNLFVGFVSTDGYVDERLSRIMPHLGGCDDIPDLVSKYDVKEAIIAVEDSEQDKIKELLRVLSTCGEIIIKVTPEARDILLGSVKVDNIFHSPLITINNRLMEEWQYGVKRMFDIIISILVMILLSPVYLITAIIVKTTSPGPIFYAQERIGYLGKPFKMHKFRSMYIDAEAAGPALSQDNDPRITPFGRFMRKVRLDEIPQFYNVLKGTMSLVGPRPERQYFIDQIVRRAPEYMLLHRVKPGITSWGQVKYGYASNVDEMVERLKYDLLYLDNMTLATDVKIMLYTVIIICQGRGK